MKNFRIAYVLLKRIIFYFRQYLSNELSNSILSIDNPTVRIHDGVIIDNTSSIGRYTVFFDAVEILNSSIGDHSYIQKNSEISSTDMGKYCSIASEVKIGLPGHEISMVSTHPSFYLKDTPLVKVYSSKNLGAPIDRCVIGNDVWIGQRASIISGVKIGNGAVIGSGAVLTKDVAPYAIMGGVPAKLIRYRFDTTVQKGLEESVWWDYEEDRLQNEVDLFVDPIKFLNTRRDE